MTKTVESTKLSVPADSAMHGLPIHDPHARLSSHSFMDTFLMEGTSQSGPHGFHGHS